MSWYLRNQQNTLKNYFGRDTDVKLTATNTGLDRLVQDLATDLGLKGNVTKAELYKGVEAATKMNQIIVEAVEATGSGTHGVFDANDVIAINRYIQTYHKDTWMQLHGDDENGEETGYHYLQNDGGSSTHQGRNIANTVADGIYHLGFDIKYNYYLVNEDGTINATLKQVASWLTEYYTDHSTTRTGLDQMTDLILSDHGLGVLRPIEDVKGGADAANGINEMIVEAVKAIGAEGRLLTDDDVYKINEYIRSNHLDEFVELHGDDELGREWGYHLVQNDGANTLKFGKNFVNTVADGVYHIGFKINNGRFYNEDGNANATVSDVKDWLNYFLVDQSNTGTGLDELVQVIKSDEGLARWTNAGDINGGAAAANAMNHILDQAIKSTGVASDGVISIDDVKAINAYIRSNHYDEWVEYHGDDEHGEETGFHLVQNDGGSARYNGDAFINTVIDGIYHMGFKINGDHIYNEDGNRNANLGDLATWLNRFYLNNERVTFGSEAHDVINGSTENELIVTRGGTDYVHGGFGNDIISAGDGIDKVFGDEGNDVIILNDDGNVDYYRGGAGSDTFVIDSDGHVGTDYILDFEKGDRLVVGSPDVNFEVTRISYNYSTVKLTNDYGQSLGTVYVNSRDFDIHDIDVNSDYHDYSDVLAG